MLDSCRALQQRGYDVTYLPVNSEGLIDVAQLEAELRPDTALVSVMAINNEIGALACCAGSACWEACASAVAAETEVEQSTSAAVQPSGVAVLWYCTP